MNVPSSSHLRIPKKDLKNTTGIPKEYLRISEEYLRNT